MARNTIQFQRWVTESYNASMWFRFFFLLSVVGMNMAFVLLAVVLFGDTWITAVLMLLSILFFSAIAVWLVTWYLPPEI